MSNYTKYKVGDLFDGNSWGAGRFDNGLLLITHLDVNSNLYGDNCPYILRFLSSKYAGLRPQEGIPAFKTDLDSLKRIGNVYDLIENKFGKILGLRPYNNRTIYIVFSLPELLAS